MTDQPRMLHSLRTLGIGDAFGFKLSIRPYMIEARRLPEGPWFWSDDTHMAMSVVEQLLNDHHIQQDDLYALFLRRFEEDPRRGYGSGMKKLLGKMRDRHWRVASTELFGGQGSFGNGAAMRVAPLGAFFHDDINRVIEQAHLSAEVTHSHPEAIASAVAVAVGAALAAQGALDGRAWLERIHHHTPDGEVRNGLMRAMSIAPDQIDDAIKQLGHGARITAQDTVPFCLWMAAYAPERYDDDSCFEETMWSLAATGGDEDTNCAIVGGILGAAGYDAPEEWSLFTESTDID